MKLFNFKTEPVLYTNRKELEKKGIVVGKAGYIRVCSDCGKMTRDKFMIGSRCIGCWNKA